MKNLLSLIFVTVLAVNCTAQCVVNYIGTYRARPCGSDTAAHCVATITQITSTKILISNFICTGNAFNAYDTIIADINCTNDSLHLEQVSYTGAGNTLTFSGSGIITPDSIKVIYHEIHPGGTTDICYIYDNKTTGITKFNTQNPTITIYPNPAQNNFTVEVSNSEKQTISIFDVNGKLVLTQAINSKAIIDAGYLNAGVYNVSITSSAGVTNKCLVIVK